MKIVTRIRASAVLAIAIALTVAVVLIFGLRAVNASINRTMSMTGSLNQIFELSMLTTDYLINHEPRAERQWRDKHDALDQDLATLRAASDADMPLIARVQEHSLEASRLFEEIVLAHEQGDSGTVAADVSLEYQERLTARLLIVMQAMVSDATTLGEHASVSAREAQEATFFLVLGLAVVGVGTMVVIGVSTNQTVVRPLVMLQDSVRRVGHGELDVRSGIESRDEVGELAVAFDGMVTDMQRSYSLLEKEIAERRRAEHALGEYRDHLEQLVSERTSALMNMNEELLAATRAKDDFMTSMSHELRTPLNSIIGFTDIMLKGLAGEVNDEQRRQLGMVLEAGQQLLGLIENVLDLSRMESGKLDAVASPCSIESGIALLVDMMSPLAFNRGLTLASRIEPDVPATIHTDRGRLHQILLNLVSNAIKFTDSGGVEIVVRPGGDRRVAFDVHDTGIGIRAEDIPHVFDHFYQAARDASKRRAGTGLGLAISQRLAENLGGTITVTSEAGVGSTFTLTLPETLPRA